MDAALASSFDIAVEETEDIRWDKESPLLAILTDEAPYHFHNQIFQLDMGSVSRMLTGLRASRTSRLPHTKEKTLIWYFEGFWPSSNLMA